MTGNLLQHHRKLEHGRAVKMAWPALRWVNRVLDIMQYLKH